MRCSNNSIRLNGLISFIISLYETNKHIALTMINKNPLMRHGSPGKIYFIDLSLSLSLSLSLCACFFFSAYLRKRQQSNNMYIKRINCLTLICIFPQTAYPAQWFIGLKLDFYIAYSILCFQRQSSPIALKTTYDVYFCDGAVDQSALLAFGRLGVRMPARQQV